MVIKIDQESSSTVPGALTLTMDKKRRKSLGNNSSVQEGPGGGGDRSNGVTVNDSIMVIKSKRRASTGSIVNNGGSPTVLDGMSVAEVTMIRRLAGNDPAVRKKTMRKLRKWLTALVLRIPEEEDPRKGLEMNMIRVWKALFYCMWMADKPLPQEQLAEQISNLVNVVGVKDNIFSLFVEWFFRTIAREWSWIDRYRLDKFMMLVRRFLRKTLLVMASKKWKKEITTSFLRTVRMHIFNHHDDQGNEGIKFSKGAGGPSVLGDGTSTRAPVGFQLHFTDIFLEELAKAGAHGLKSGKVMRLLAPFIEEMASSDDKRVLSAITERIFHHLMRQSDVGIDYQESMMELDEYFDEDEEDEEEDVGENDDSERGQATNEIDEVYEADDGSLDPRAGAVDVILPQLQLDYGLLAEKLTEAGGNKAVKKRNRSKLYSLASCFKDLEQGKYPLALPELTENKRAIPKKELKKATSRLLEMEGEGASSTPKIRKTKKQRRREARMRAQLELEQTENLDDTIGSEDNSAYLNDHGLLDKVDNSYSDYVSEQMDNFMPEDEADSGTSIPKRKLRKRKSDNGEQVKPHPEDEESRSKRKYKTVVEFEADELKKEDQEVQLDKRSSYEEPTKNDTIVYIPIKKKKPKTSLPATPEGKPKSLSPESLQLKSGLSSALLNASLNARTPSLGRPSPIRRRKLKTPLSERKKINFAMTRNLEHDATDYLPSVSRSPALPYDAEKTPTNGILKKTPATPVSPNRKQVGVKCSPRRKALDFF